MTLRAAVDEMLGVHVMRLELALALGGYAVFCSCGKLTGFAVTAHDAECIHSDHVERASRPVSS